VCSSDLRGLKVLLIDLNCFHPSLASLWHLPPADGVSELLKGAASMSDSVRKVGPEELYLLPYGKADDVVWPQLAPKILADWLATLKNGFDVLLLDLPAVGYGEGAPLAALADQTLMVVAADHTPREQVARALEQIQRCGARIAGIVLNRYRKLELWPLISPTISAMANWPPVSRLGTSLKNRGKFKSS
jgi:Mrp family chromosome partitioning ATPase